MRVSRLATLVQWLKDADIDTFEFKGQGISLRIVMEHQSQSEAIRPTNYGELTATSKGSTHVISGDVNGIFFAAHPLMTGPMVAVGDIVTVGDVLGFLRVTSVLYKAVPADRKGRVIRTVAADGQQVEAGTPLFELDVH